MYEQVCLLAGAMLVFGGAFFAQVKWINVVVIWKKEPTVCHYFPDV